MTIKQFRKKVDIARKYGEAKMENGSVLRFTGNSWSIRDKNGNTVDIADAPKQLDYLYE